MDEMVTIRPRVPCATMLRAAAWQDKKTPRRFVSMTAGIPRRHVHAQNRSIWNNSGVRDHDRRWPKRLLRARRESRDSLRDARHARDAIGCAPGATRRAGSHEHQESPVAEAARPTATNAPRDRSCVTLPKQVVIRQVVTIVVQASKIVVQT